MSEDYKDLVLATYKEKRDNGTLNLILPRETTAKIKRACLKVYDSRYIEKDSDILSVFFDVDKMGCDFRQTILNAEPDDFKALYNHLKGITESTDERNSDLLAWLIDFEPRPSINYYINLKENPSQEKNKPTTKTLPTTKPDTQPSKNSKPPLAIKSILMISIICLIIGYSAFIFWENSPITIRVPNNNEKFMYWTDDHYEPINSNEIVNGAMKVPLNLEKLNHLKKINLPDTLTKNSIGKVWYTGRGEGREYFTDSGMHPVDTVKRLLPITDYILTRYTSYYRYLLIRLSIAVGLIGFVVISSILISLIRRKKLITS